MAYEAIKNLSKKTTYSSTKKSTKSTTSDDDDLFRRVAAYARAKDQGSTVENTDAPTVESRVEMPQIESSIRTYHPITPTKAQANYNYGNVYASRFQPDETEEEEDNGYRDATLKDLTINSLKQGYYNALYGSESFKAMMGSENEKQKYEDILAGEDYQFNTDNWLEKGISGGANLIGQMARQWTNPRSIAAGTAAATAAGIAGQAGPQVLVPEEIVTVPGAFMLGMQAGSAASNFEIEAGLAYNEMIDNGISEDTAKKIAMCVGGVNAALEFVQGDEIVKSLKILNKNPATKEAANTLGKRLVDMGIDVTKSVGSETLQEVAQEGSTIAGTQIGSKIDTGDWAYNPDEVLNRLGETAASSALSFGLLNVPGAALRGNSIISENNTKNKIGSKYNADINALVEEGLQSDQNSDSYRIASRLKEKLDSGETVSNSEAYDLAVANQKAINLEERNKAPAAASPSVTSVTASAETAAPAAQSRLQSIQSRLVESGMDAERASSTAQSISRILGGDTSVTGSDKDVLRVGNTAARTIFEEESGVKLPASNASTRKTVADYIAQTALSQQKQNTASDPKAQSAENVMESWQKQKAQEETVSQLKSKAMDNASAVASPETTLRQAAEYASRRVNVKNDIVIQNAVSTVGTNGNAVYQKYLGGAKNISSYTRAFERYYDAGQIGYPLERIDSAYSEGVDPKMLVEAYRAGQRDTFVPSEGKRTAQNQKATKRVKTRNKGKGRLYDNRTAVAKSVSEKDTTALKQMAKVFNVDIEVVDTIADDSGRSIANGYYDAAAGKIVIAADSDNPMMTVAKHEITHYLQRVNPQKYQEYKDYVMRAFYGNSQEAMNAEIQRRIDLAHMANQNLTRNQAMDEIVADATEKFLTDRESIDALVRENRSLAETILNAIRDVLRKMEAAMRGEKIGAKSDFLDIEQLKTAEKMWVDALTSAAMEDNVGIRYDGSTESFAPVWSLKTWNESEYVKQRKEAAKEIAEAIGISQKKALDYINSVNSIAKMIAEDRGRLDYESSPGRSSFVGNVEYGGSFDFSTLCKKRRLLTGTFSEIQNALPNTALTADEILEIRNMMADAGLEVSCGLCYVEGSRASMGEFTKEFIRLYRKYNPDAWYPDLATMNTPDGIEWVRINHTEVYSEYEKFWNNHGKLRDSDPNLFASQQKPKLYQMRTEYKNEVLKNFKKDSTVSKKNENGGIRLQSFSDFEVVHLLDTMQIIMDMSRVGLAGQAYTKVPDFAWALGDTGLKINLSLIAKDVDENGKLIFDDREGMPIADAMKLRDRYSKNVGTIIVTFTDDQLKAAMADPRIDFIIPFHRSQWKKRQYGAMGLPANTKDYTYQQNEKLIKKTYHEYRGRMVPDKATNYMPNTYWDFGKSGKENAENYLKMCAANNKRPKFYKFLKNNGDGSYSLQPDGSTDGYWKLLIDFKMYDNDGVGSPQMPVKPDFNMEECRRMLNEYEGGHEKFPVAQGIVDQFVSKYKEEHKGVQFSLKDSTGRSLTKEQADFFKDSKVRDKNGSLMVVYHGTPRGGFNEFSKSSIGTTSDYGYLGRGFYFTTKERVAKYYAGYLNSSEVKTGYVNITNPYIIPSKHDLAFTLESIMGHRYDGDNSDYERSVAFTNWLKDNGYDGVICGDEIMALRSNQFKNKDNTNPTSDPDIRYSFKEFSEAEKEAVKRFGTTTDFAEAGFILPTGEMLRFTDDAHKGERAYDHRAIGIVYGVDVDLGVNHGFNFESGKFLDEFVENGGIRFDAGDPGLDMDVGLQLSSTVPLTRAQEQLIRDLVSWKKEREIQFEAKPEEEKWMYGGPLAIRIDFGGDAEYAVGSSNAKDLAAWGKKSLEYDGGNINADRIINDIRHYYRTGEVKQPSAVAQFRYSLKDVPPVEPKNGKWMRGATFDEVKEKHPTLFELAADEAETRNPTQITGTVKSYRKIYDSLKEEGFDGTILDASSGLGYGTRAGINEYGFDVEDIEPFPDASYHPKYTDYSTLDKQYDVIISNAVLNVIPQDLRDNMVVKIGEMLKPGGRAFINVRGKDVLNASSKVAINEDQMEYFISSTGSYQKGFTKSELVGYLQDALGDGFTVEATNKYGAVAAIVTKNGDTGIQYQLKTPDEMVSVTNQIMDEERRAKAVTDAEIMSQAVKDIAKTDAEKKAVSDYQRAMKRLAEYEKELAVYDATKAEHSKGRSIYTDASGKVKKSGVKYSAAEKAELQRKADWWKNRLREIEQKDAFQKVLKREKSKIAQKHADEILKLKELYRVRMEKLRGQRDEAVDKARKAGSQKLKDYKQFQRDSKEYKALKDKLKEDVQWLSERLVSPSDAKHIPEELRKGVAAFLESLDFETKYTDSYEVRNGKPSDRIIKLRELHDAYEKILQDQSSTMELDQTQLDALNNLQAICENKRLADLSYEELGLVRDAIQYIRMTVNAANKTFNQNIKESISDLGESLIIEQRKKKTRKNRIGVLGEGDKLINFDNVSPADKFHEYGGVMEKLYGEIRNGFDRHIDNVKTAIDYTQNLTAGHEADIKEWSGNKAKAKQFKISDGTTIELTAAQVMSLYELMKRDQAVGHVLGSGIIPSSVVVTESKKYGKVKIDTAKQISAEKASRCTLEDIQKIVDTLTDDQKKIADGISKLFTTKCADWGNETSMRLYGYKKFKEKNYFPIKSSDAYLNARFDDSGDALIKNLGFTKNTVVNANNPIVVEDIFDVLADHVNKMSMYNALVVPLTDFNRVFNYKSRNADGTISDSVPMALEASGGKLGVSYVKQFMKDVNKQAASLQSESFFNMAIANYKKAKIAASVRVLVQQPTSITRASDMIDPKYIVKGLAQKANYEEMFQNSPIAYWKSLGFYQTDMARNMKDILLGNESLMDRYTMGVYGKADDFSWGHLWNAVKLEQADLHPDVDKTSSEFMDLVSNRFEEVVDRTQVVDSVFHRSQIMRAPGAAAKMATAFMSEPAKAFNLLRTDLIDSVNSKDYSKVGRSVAVYIANAIFVSAAAGLVDVLRDDDDEGKEVNKRTLADKYIENTLENVKDNINPLNMIPYLKELSSVWSGYSVNRMDMASISNMATTLHKWTSGKYSWPYLAKETAGAVGEVFGIPAKNVMRDLISVVRTTGDLVGGHYYAEYMVSKLKYNIANSQNRSVFYKHYTDALLAGDDAAAELILQDMVVNGIPYDNIISRGYQAEKAVVFKEARNLISDGNTTDAKKLVRDLAKKYGKKYSTLWKSVKEGASAEEPEETYDFNDLKDAVRKGQDTEEIEDYLTEYGGYSEEAMDEAIRMLTEKYR